ncbi:hypothetical protein HOY34_13770 [Xinfangfangia sp. D13-10-4-6]|uniref:hypothetical protein n=1 Tax=Pseudogemmobacter hezensis TaxID=2737662 RepID=UPI001552ACCC|nr:hypothetical protein [Pseudogemmobacter hezensis]NPD16263.1 hypothetical protein [Pseudogemmobacter hezensis]
MFLDQPDQGEGRDQKKTLDEVHDEARRGSEAMRAWWKSASEASRKVASTILPEPQEMAAKADGQAKQSVSDDPFASLTPATDDGPTPEQIAAQEAAFAELERQRQGQGQGEAV